MHGSGPNDAVKRVRLGNITRVKVQRLAEHYPRDATRFAKDIDEGAPCLAYSIVV